MKVKTPLDVNNKSITSVAAPVSGTDAANKDYVDTQITAAIAASVSKPHPFFLMGG